MYEVSFVGGDDEVWVVEGDFDVCGFDVGDVDYYF